MRILELFSGTGTFSRIARERGHEAFTVDLFEPADLNADVLTLTADDIYETAGWEPETIDLLWASPICTGFSVAAIGRSWHHPEPGVYIPKSETAALSLALLNRTFELIEEFRPRLWFVENPMGMARKMPVVQGHRRVEVTFCLAGETEVITRDGQKPIRDLVGMQELLMPDGTWQKAPIRSYGKSKLVELTVRRAGVEKVIRATPNHLWFVEAGSRTWLQRTDQLRRGDRLPSAHAQADTGPLPTEAVARGFTFGDGSATYRDLADGTRKHYASRLTIYGEKVKDLLPYYEGLGTSRREHEAGVDIHGLPLEWKMEVPSGDDLDEVRGWLAGYLAADGTVSKNGQVTISSAKRENLEAFRDLANLVGVGCYDIHTQLRRGFGEEETPLHTMGLIRTNLTPDFFIRQLHRDRHFQPEFVPVWRVVGVKELDEVEEVFCAEVDGYEAFTLGGNIVTHNCQYGETRQKPTDIWTNDDGWVARPKCKRGAPCHEAAPRGARTGTQGIKGALARAKLPTELCLEVIERAEGVIGGEGSIR